MKSIFVVAFVVFLTCESISCDDVPINEDTVGGGVRKVYHIKTDFLANWHKANHYCVSNGMRLASVTTEDENQELIRVITKSGYREPLWIGGTDMGAAKRQYYWMGNKKAMKFTNWAEGEPNSAAGNANCLEVWLRNGFEWNDNACTLEHPFICETA